jgi:WXG100 family type VII secretion target
MSAEVIQSKYEELENIARRFEQQAQATRALQQRVQRSAGALRNGGWVGRGSTAFTSEMEQKLFPGLQRLFDALTAAHSTTVTIAQLIREAEEEAASVFRGDYSKTPGEANARLRVDSAAPSIAKVAPYEYALMSQAAYSEGGALPAALETKGWRVLRGAETDTGYFGMAYINDRTGEVVIAHRGTNPDLGDAAEVIGAIRSPLLTVSGIGREIFRGVGINQDGSDLDDDAMIAIGKAPDQYDESKPFINTVIEQMNATGRSHYQITHTGHSLGGALADLHAAGNGHRAITFDNPGTREILADLNQHYDKTKHLSYQSHANLVNPTNTPAGFSIDIKLNTDSKILGVIPDVLHDHSLDNMVSAIDPTTGRPYRESLPIPH